MSTTDVGDIGHDEMCDQDHITSDDEHDAPRTGPRAHFRAPTPVSSGARHATRQQYLDSRSERGLIQYDNCSEAALRRFAGQRGLLPRTTIVCPHFRDRTRRELVDMLERADEDPRFHSFFQVPPEVRNLIYTIHLDSLPQDGALSRTPFLSHASPQLRREVLPLWYGTQTLEIPMHIQARYSLDHERHRKIEYMHDIKASSTDPARPYTILHTLIRRTEAFLTHAPDYIFAMLKHILISVQIEVTCCQDEPGCTVNDTFLLELEIDFDGETQPWTTWSSGTSFLGGGVEDRREEVNDAGGQMMDDMERNLRILMREIRKRDDDGGEGRMRLRRRDLEWMREVVRLGVW